MARFEVSKMGIFLTTPDDIILVKLIIGESICDV